MNLGDVLNSFNLNKTDAEQIEGIFTKKISLSNGDFLQCLNCKENQNKIIL